MPAKKKKTQKKDSEDKEIFYVGIKDPTEIRRNLLESTKDVVTFLKSYENFKKVRAEKVEEISKLKATIEDITRLINKLNRELPRTRLRAEPQPEKKAKTVRRAPVPKKPRLSDVEKLGKELEEIENKLKTL